MNDELRYIKVRSREFIFYVELSKYEKLCKFSAYKESEIDIDIPISINLIAQSSDIILRIDPVRITKQHKHIDFAFSYNQNNIKDLESKVDKWTFNEKWIIEPKRKVRI